MCQVAALAWQYCCLQSGYMEGQWIKLGFFWPVLHGLYNLPAGKYSRLLSCAAFRLPRDIASIVWPRGFFVLHLLSQWSTSLTTCLPRTARCSTKTADSSPGMWVNKQSHVFCFFFYTASRNKLSLQCVFSDKKPGMQAVSAALGLQC